MLSPAQITEMTTYRDTLNPAEIGRQIANLQAVLTKLAAEKTEQLYLATLPAPLPELRKGIRTRAS